MEQQQISIDPNLLDELAKSIKSEKDLAALSKQLLKLTLEGSVASIISLVKVFLLSEVFRYILGIMRPLS